MGGWFLIDIVSAFPYGLTNSESDFIGELKLLRLFRLLKLVKVVETGRAVDTMKEFLRLRHSTEMIAVTMALIFFMIHWVACMWMLTVSVRFSKSDHKELYDSWYVQGNYGQEWPPNLWKMFPICLYWACQTITTIGYGDVANPGTNSERWVAVIAM